MANVIHISLFERETLYFLIFKETKMIMVRGARNVQWLRLKVDKRVYEIIKKVLLGKDTPEDLEKIKDMDMAPNEMVVFDWTQLIKRGKALELYLAYNQNHGPFDFWGYSIILKYGNKSVRVKANTEEYLYGPIENLAGENLIAI